MNYCVVKRPVTFKSFLPPLLIALFALFLAFLVMILTKFVYIPLLIVIASLAIDLYLAPRFLVNEYEYSVEGGVFSAAIIMNKKARRELFSADAEKLAACAPRDASQHGAVKKIDITSKENSDYYALFNTEDGSILILFSPSEEFLKELWLLAPSRVKLSQ